MNTSIAPTLGQTTVVVDSSIMAQRVLGMIQGFCSLLCLLGIIIGIIFMVKSKKTKGKRILFGLLIMAIPFIIYWIVNIIRFRMYVGM